MQNGSQICCRQIIIINTYQKRLILAPTCKKCSSISKTCWKYCHAPSHPKLPREAKARNDVSRFIWKQLMRRNLFARLPVNRSTWSYPRRFTAIAISDWLAFLVVYGSDGVAHCTAWLIFTTLFHLRSELNEIMKALGKLSPNLVLSMTLWCISATSVQKQFVTQRASQPWMVFGSLSCCLLCRMTQWTDGRYIFLCCYKSNSVSVNSRYDDSPYMISVSSYHKRWTETTVTSEELRFINTG